MHQRQRIREAVKAALVNATDANDRVFETRVFAWKVSELPGISVYTLNETVDPQSNYTAPKELKRTLSLAVECAVDAGDSADDAVDDLCRQVEKAMHADDTFGGVCSFSVLESTTVEVVASEQLVGMVRLVYTVRYFTYAPETDDAPLDNFETAGVETKITGHTMPDADDAENEIDAYQRYLLRPDASGETPTFETNTFSLAGGVRNIFFWLQVNELPSGPRGWQLDVFTPSSTPYTSNTGTLELGQGIALDLPVAATQIQSGHIYGRWSAVLSVAGVPVLTIPFTITA